MPVSRKEIYRKYNQSPKGRIRKARHNITEKARVSRKKWIEKHPEYWRNWRIAANDLIGCSYAQNWGLYKLFKGLRKNEKNPNGYIVE